MSCSAFLITTTNLVKHNHNSTHTSLMSGIIPDAVRAVKSTMTSSGDKLADLARNTVEPSDQDRYTSDFGVRQANNDDWLKVTSDDKQGPMLLEDTFGREKVGH